MNTLLLDASVVLAAFDQDDPHKEAALAVLGDDSVSLMTIDLARYEIANVVVRAWAMPQLVSPFLAALERMEDDGGIVTSTNALIGRAAELADHHSISVYDAAYVAASADGDRQLVSCDERDLVSKGLAVLPGDALAA